jgi:hypothetical protein
MFLGRGFDSHWVPYWRACTPCHFSYDLILKLGKSQRNVACFSHSKHKFNKGILVFLCRNRRRWLDLPVEINRLGQVQKDIVNPVANMVAEKVITAFPNAPPPPPPPHCHLLQSPADLWIVKRRRNRYSPARCYLHALHPYSNREQLKPYTRKEKLFSRGHSSACFVINNRDQAIKYITCFQGFGSALLWVAGSGSGSAFKLQIRIQEGKNDPQKKKKVENFHVFKYWMFSFEGWRLLL